MDDNGKDVPTKTELEEIIIGLGGDPKKGLDAYVKIGENLYPKAAPVTLKWEGEYGEFKQDPSWYFEENGAAMRERLDAWGIDYDDYLGDFVHYGGTHWEDTRTGIQAKISQSWDSLEALMAQCDASDIGLADCMEIEAPYGKRVVSGLHFAEDWRSEQSATREYEEEIEEESFEGSLAHEMVLIPAGAFLMGAHPDDDEADDDEKPRHKVEITKAFYVGKYPVTQKLWKAVMGNNPSRFKGEDRPVEEVSWFDCVDFCNKLSELEGKEPVYQGLEAHEMGGYPEDEKALSEKVVCNWSANGYRLLTEAEWEYAARAPAAATQGARAKYPPYAARAPVSDTQGARAKDLSYAARNGAYHLYSGSNNVDEVAWYWSNSEGQTHPVGQKKPNGFGLYDISGNVWEWCWDWFGDYSPETQSDPTGGPSCPVRVGRGGSWDNAQVGLRVSRRAKGVPSVRLDNLGFRLGRSL